MSVLECLHPKTFLATLRSLRFGASYVVAAWFKDKSGSLLAFEIYDFHVEQQRVLGDWMTG
jgi:hypothetical protein